jgi:hypothetical protein
MHLGQLSAVPPFWDAIVKVNPGITFSTSSGMRVLPIDIYFYTSRGLPVPGAPIGAMPFDFYTSRGFPNPPGFPPLIYPKPTSGEFVGAPPPPAFDSSQAPGGYSLLYDPRMKPPHINPLVDPVTGLIYGGKDNTGIVGFDPITGAPRYFAKEDDPWWGAVLQGLAVGAITFGAGSIIAAGQAAAAGAAAAAESAAAVAPVVTKAIPDALWNYAAGTAKSLATSAVLKAIAPTPKLAVLLPPPQIVNVTLDNFSYMQPKLLTEPEQNLTPSPDTGNLLKIALVALSLFSLFK